MIPGRFEEQLGLLRIRNATAASPSEKGVPRSNPLEHSSDTELGKESSHDLKLLKIRSVDPV